MLLCFPCGLLAAEKPGQADAFSAGTSAVPAEKVAHGDVPLPPRPPAASDEQARAANQHRRSLMAVVWNLAPDHLLCWDVAIGHLENDEFVPERLDQRYCVDPDAGTMSYAGETRRFDAGTREKEKRGLHYMLDLLTEYAIASVHWWEDGKGEPVSQKNAAAESPVGPREH